MNERVFESRSSHETIRREPKRIRKNNHGYNSELDNNELIPLHVKINDEKKKELEAFQTNGILKLPEPTPSTSLTTQAPPFSTMTNNNHHSIFYHHSHPPYPHHHPIVVPVWSSSPTIQMHGSTIGTNQPLTTIPTSSLPLPPTITSSSNPTCNIPTHVSPPPLSNCIHTQELITVITQPARFQIGNYNVYPPPVITILGNLNNNETVYAYLVESESLSVISNGFQSGDVRIIRPGTKELHFGSLKLSKKGNIKSELHDKNSKKVANDISYCIKFSISTASSDNQLQNAAISCYSDPFKLVSSYSQLPPDIRDSVRPSRKASLSSEKQPTNHGSQDDDSFQLSDESNSSSSLSISNHESALIDDQIKKMREKLDHYLSLGDDVQSSKCASDLAKFIKTNKLSSSSV